MFFNKMDILMGLLITNLHWSTFTKNVAYTSKWHVDAVCFVHSTTDRKTFLQRKQIIKVTKKMLTWSQHCGGDAVSDTKGGDCYVVWKVTLLMQVTASPGETQMLVDWSCSLVVVVQAGVWPVVKLVSPAAFPQYCFLHLHFLMRMKSHRQRATELHKAAAAEDIGNTENTF
jgi:hypothetical protein